jgi:peptidoglycan-N-acetylglucosamine deacetylase
MSLHKYFVKTPWIVKKVFPSYIWNMPVCKKDIYLTFDDGPHPEITLFVLEELEKYNAKASFFCVGNNVELYPNIYRQIIEKGHSVGNHSYSHPNGWETPAEKYLEDVRAASGFIETNLFRPPYGRIKNKQAQGLKKAMNRGSVKLIMWDVLSLDFDTSFSPTECLNNVMKNTSNGSIVVFHDSEKAFRNLKYSFPEAIKQLAGEGYHFKNLEAINN